MKEDRALFIQSYLSYNPVTKDIEKRELIPYRNVDRVYIGDQSVEEKYFERYTAFVNGPIVAEDVLFLESKQSLLEVIQKLTSEIQTLRSEVANLKVQTKQQHIYR
jgi:predicted ATP-binding protein involved in virulence